jgi:hypothetical protein
VAKARLATEELYKLNKEKKRKPASDQEKRTEKDL